MASDSPSSLSGYLAGLDTVSRSQFVRLAESVAATVGEPGAETVAFVFVAGQPRHPVHPNARDMFWHAVEQLMFEDPEGEAELPLLFLGYLARSRRPLPRAAYGFLLTDRRLIARDEATLFGERALVRSYSLNGEPPHAATAPATIVAHAWRSFSNRSLEQFALSTAAARLQALLTDAVATVVARRSEFGRENRTAAAAAARQSDAAG